MSIEAEPLSDHPTALGGASTNARTFPDVDSRPLVRLAFEILSAPEHRVPRATGWAARFDNTGPRSDATTEPTRDTVIFDTPARAAT